MTKANAKVIEESIIGVFGEKVNVGDKVMVVTTGSCHRVYVSKGVYKGYIVSTGSYYPKRARIEIQETRKEWFNPDGTPFDWAAIRYDAWKDVQPTLTVKEVPYIRKTTLMLNRIATLKD